MQVSGFWDTVSAIVFSVLVCLTLPSMVIGGLFGITLARRTTKLPRHYMPPWRKLSRFAWRIMAAGWICAAVAGVAGVWKMFWWRRMPYFSEILAVLLLLWAVTAVISPFLWIAAWLKARRPDRFTVFPPREATDTEGVWPPPPK